jgi:hypothetical protein
MQVVSRRNSPEHEVDKMGIFCHCLGAQDFNSVSMCTFAWLIHSPSLLPRLEVKNGLCRQQIENICKFLHCAPFLSCSLLWWLLYLPALCMSCRAYNVYSRQCCYCTVYNDKARTKKLSTLHLLACFKQFAELI